MARIGLTYRTLETANLSVAQHVPLIEGVLLVVSFGKRLKLKKPLRACCYPSETECQVRVPVVAGMGQL